MWLLTQFGFFSVVQYRGDRRQLFVRARVKADLESLLRFVTPSGKAGWPKRSDIIETRNADYRYRILVSRGQLQTITHMVCGALDYSNFKDRIGEQDPERERIYHEVWAVLTKLATLEARPAGAPSASVSPPAKKATRPPLPR